MKARVLALSILQKVIIEKRALEKIPQTNDAPFVQALCYGVCRWYYRLDFILQYLMPKPLKKKNQDIYCILLIGIYQLSEMRIPAHAAVSETVALTKKTWAKALVNAVLRNYERQKNNIEVALSKNLVAFYAHPEWMIDKLKSAWPDDWEEVLKANNQHPPFALRVNLQKITREAYLKKYSGNVFVIPETDAGIVLKEPCPVLELPGFLEGEVSVQDGAAQLAAFLLMLSAKQRVLDACAAPGGKTAHILESQPDVDLIAIDKDPERLKDVRENLNRLKLSAKCIAGDAKDTKAWWDGRLFDRILLDAPCSGSGVIRRHPDIKLLRQPEDIAKLAEEQKRLLKALWPLLKIGGILVYSTCSIFPDENVAVVQEFLKSTKDAKEEKILGNFGKQILPGNLDGFYYARFKKKR